MILLPSVTLPPISGNPDGHITDEFATFVHSHGILHHHSLRMRWRDRRKRCGRLLTWRKSLLLLLLLRKRDTHVSGRRHGNSRDELTERAFDALGAVRVHERHPAAAAIDVRHLRGFHGQVHGVAAGALHAGGAPHVHEQRPTPCAHELRHLGPVGRHLSDGVAKRASHIAGAVRVDQQRATAIAN